MQRSKILSSKFNYVLSRSSPNFEPPYTKHPIFYYFTHSFVKLKNICSIESAKWRAKFFPGASESKEHCVRIQPHLSL
jgi:hypothetical protein